MTIHDFLEKAGYGWAGLMNSEDHLPCFAHRITVAGGVNSEAMIKELIKHAMEESDNDVLVFSVTERDKCWKAWNTFHKAHPKTFKMLEGGSIHGVYKCRMYIYTKPAKKRKFHPDNLPTYRGR